MSLIHKEGSKVIHQGYIGNSESIGCSWCNTSGWKHKWLEFVGKIKLPYRECKICFRNENK